MRLTIEKSKRVQGEFKLLSLKLKDGQWFVKTSLTTTIEDDQLGDTTLSSPISSVGDQLKAVRAGAADGRVTNFAAEAKLSGIEYVGTLWANTDEPPELEDVPCFLRRVTAKAGPKHVHQVAYIDWLLVGVDQDAPSILWGAMGMHDSTAIVRLKLKPGSQNELPFGEDTGPDEEFLQPDDKNEELPLEPGESKPGPKRAKSKGVRAESLGGE
jgi:hypothetical protein